MSASEQAKALVRKAAAAAEEIKAEDLVALDVSSRMPLTDIFLVASGNSERQVIAIAEAIEKALHEDGVKALRREGLREGRWALLDFSHIIVHVMHQEDRVYYELERLWKDCPVVDLS